MGGGVSALEPQFSDQQVLVDLGLTPKQARVYLALVKSGPLRIAEISKNAEVARPDVYQTLERLQQVGLVERIITSPLQYKAIPMDDGLSLLLETRTNQYEKVKAETEVLRATIKTEKPDKPNEEESHEFVLIPGGKSAIERIGEAIKNAQQSIDIILSWKRIAHGVLEVFSESLEIAWAKKVKVRCISEKPPENKTSEQLIEYFREKPSNQMRFVPYYPATVFGIYDEKEISLAVVPKTDLESSPTLWSTNKALVSLAADHFEVLWRSATEITQ